MKNLILNINDVLKCYESKHHYKIVMDYLRIYHNDLSDSVKGKILYKLGLAF